MARKQRRRKQKAEPEVRDYKSILKKIKPVSDFDPEFKVVLYGKAGKGKTTLACSFPKPILLLDIKERGTDSVRDIKGLKVLRPESWEDVEMAYWLLKDGDHKFKTFIWDTASNLQRLLIEKVTQEHNIDGEPGWWGTMTKRDWGRVSAPLNHAIDDWRNLPMNGVFIAHDRIFAGIEGDDEEDEDVIEPSVGPNLIPSVVTTLNAAVGIIGNTFIREKTRHISIGKGKKKKKKTKKEIQYCLRIGPHAYYTTKMRNPKSIEVPQVIVDPTYQKIKDLMTGDSDE